MLLSLLKWLRLEQVFHKGIQCTYIRGQYPQATNVAAESARGLVPEQTQGYRYSEHGRSVVMSSGSVTVSSHRITVDDTALREATDEFVRPVRRANARGMRTGVCSYA